MGVVYFLELRDVIIFLAIFFLRKQRRHTSHFLNDKANNERAL